jgi:signal transduction histidine kinase/PAS domain-containing protein
MTFEYSPYVLPLIVAAFISIIVAVYTWMHRSSNGAYALFLMAVAIFEWTFAYALEIAGINLETKYFWGVVQYFGIAFVPYSWFVFSISYSNLTKLLSRRFLFLTGLIPFITLLLAATTKWHGMIWSGYAIQRNGSFSAIKAVYGLWFWVHFGYSYLVLLAGTALLIRALWRKQGMYRGQIIAMLIGVLAPWFGNALYLTGNSPIPNLDLTPFAFTITVASLAWAIFGFRLMDIAPLARDRVLDAMSDGVIILNPRDNVVDINQSAAQMIGVLVPNAIGKSADEIFQPWTHLVEQVRANLKIEDEISVGEGEARRSYEVRVSPLKDQYGQVTGRMVMLRAAGGDEIPQPRFAAHEPTSRPLDEENRAEIPPSAASNLAEFFMPRLRPDIPLDSRYSPAWSRTLERIFTLVLRIIAFLGLIAAVLVLPGMNLQFAYLVSTIAIIVIFWMLALWRTLKLSLRTTVFVLSLYGLAITEMYNYGYSVEAFIYFVAIAVFGALFDELRGGLATLFISLAVMATFGALIAQRIYHPVGVIGTEVTPEDVGRVFSSLIAYTAVTASLISFITVLLRSLNRAWQTETQTLNLLQQERDLLEQRVQERTQKLHESNESLLLARDQALEASRLKSHLLARVSHELRTPLGSVLGYAELVEGNVYGEITDEQKDVMGKIIESTNYLTGIVNDLLDTAQIETKGLSLKMDFFSPEVLLKQVNERMAVLARNKGLTFETSLIQPFPEKLYGDEKRIQQILDNLCSNSVKFTRSGGVTVRLYQPAPHQWRMEVADTGVGIPKEAQQDIYVPFHQLSSKITHDNRGTGLGLSIVKQIVEIMGGTIELNSKVNQSSIFTVTLPIAQPQEAVL